VSGRAVVQLGRSVGVTREEINKLRKVVLADLALVRDPVVKACAKRRLNDLDSEIARLDALADQPTLFGPDDPAVRIGGNPAINSVTFDGTGPNP
jgi:hypothetical protein